MPPFAPSADRCTSVSDKDTFGMSAVRPPGATPPARPGMHPEGVLAVVCLDNPRDNTRGKALWTALPSPGPREECPWRLSDVIPARMVSHTLRTWTCSHLTWRGQSSRPPAVSPSRVRPMAVSASGTMRRAASLRFPLRRPDGGRDRRWDHSAVRPWRRRPVRRSHGTRAHQPERRWGPPDRYRALSGLADGVRRTAGGATKPEIGRGKNMAEKIRYNKIIDLLEHGKPVFSTSTVPNGSLDDLTYIADADYDAVIIEMEHEGFSFATLRTSLQALLNRKRIAEKGNLQPDVVP